MARECDPSPLMPPLPLHHAYHHSSFVHRPFSYLISFHQRLQPTRESIQITPTSTTTTYIPTLVPAYTLYVIAFFISHTLSSSLFSHCISSSQHLWCFLA
uniref:Uncharacterized protein n=1 Tax=Leishmania guyanensis TaxID=5670 RepID=A0A1E1IQN4_LEIGU|nr:Hypothetical protein BN36_1010820 [Leishmania guyanensis]